MRSIVLVMVLAGCGGARDNAAAEKFIDGYADAFEKISAACEQKRTALVEAGGMFQGAQEAAHAIVIGRAVRDAALPEAPESLASCRRDAVAALGAVQTALAPMFAKLDEKAPGPIVNAMWLEARPAFERAMRDVQQNWKFCGAEAEAAKLDRLRLIAPYFIMGC